jgi:hypothetical protein
MWSLAVADGRKRIVRVRRDDVEARFPGLLEAVLGKGRQVVPGVDGAPEVRSGGRR